MTSLRPETWPQFAVIAGTGLGDCSGDDGASLNNSRSVSGGAGPESKLDFWPEWRQAPCHRRHVSDSRGRSRDLTVSAIAGYSGPSSDFPEAALGSSTSKSTVQ